MAAAKDKRNTDRSKKRVMVRFGVEKLDKTAFTKNISATGLYIQTNNVIGPGTTIQLELQFPDRTISLWGRVVWAKKVPPQLAHVLECGMGVCFINPGTEWIQYFQAWNKVRAGA